MIGCDTHRSLKRKNSDVKIATVDDEGDIFWFLVRELWEVNKNGWGYPYDPVLVTKKIQAGTRPNPEDRSDPNDQERGIIGIIRSNEGNIVASVGLFLGPPMWFTNVFGMNELWLTVARNYRGIGLERRLFEFARWSQDKMKSDPAMTAHKFPLSTGFYHDGSELSRMEKLWQRLSGGRKIGVLYLRD